MKAASSAALPSPPSGWTKSSSPARRVAAQGEDVLDPGRLDPVQRRRQPLGGLADAAEVGHRLEAELVLQRRGDLDRAVAGRAAGAVGDRDEVGLQLRQLARRRVAAASVASSVFGGKNSTEKVGRRRR